MRIVFISEHGADPETMMVPAERMRSEKGWEVDLHCYGADDLDRDPLIYHDAVLRTADADLVVVRCMTDPTRIRRFRDYEPLLRKAPGYVMVYSGNADVCMSYRHLFKGTDEEHAELSALIGAGGDENGMGVIMWLNHMLTGEGEVPKPKLHRSDGVYHAGFPRDVTLDDYIAGLDPGRPCAAVMFQAGSWVHRSTESVDRLVSALERRGMNTIPVFFNTPINSSGPAASSMSVFRRYLMDGDRCRADAVIMMTPWSQLDNSRECSGIFTPDEQNFFHTMTDVPVFHAMAASGPYADFEAESSGADSRSELSISVVLPEMDGQIITVPVSGGGYPSGGRRPVPLDDRIEHLAETVSRWVSLARKPPCERRIAILFYQSRDAGRIGGAAGLDTMESVSDLLKRFAADGYTLDHVPADGRELVDELRAGITNDLEWTSPETVREKAPYLMGKDEYLEHYSRASEFNRGQMEAAWGEPPGTVSVDGGKLVIPGTVNGNIYLGYQPLRSSPEGLESMYHDPLVPMPHQYLAFYRWLKHGFGADMIIHMGTHGTLEWLPGKSMALSSKCYPDLVLDGMPNVYPYVIDDPGEGIQCKRRTESVLIGHMCPVMTRAGGYDELYRIEAPLQELFKSRGVSGERRALMLTQIADALHGSDMCAELSIPEDVDAEGVEAYLPRIHDYIQELKDALIRDGLHVFGRPPEGKLKDEAIYGLMRLRNGGVPPVRDALAAEYGLDMDVLAADPSGFTGDRLNSDIIDEIDGRTMDYLEELRLGGYDAGSVADCGPQLRNVTEYICGVLSVNLDRMTDEMDNLMHACDGGYTVPGPSGAPTRGNAHLLPMGRNFYGIDPEIVPPPASWEVGRRMADQMIQRYVDDTGTYPREVGIVIWATDTMKTNGDDVAYILWLMGVRPVWSDTGGKVTGVEVIPIGELGRPRIDVTVRITGLFRDTFPNLIDLIDDAVRMVAELDESEEENYLAANLRRDIIEGIEKGMAVDEARRQSSVRIFGSPPGGYGAGVNMAIESGDWETVKDLADIYVSWGSYGYGRGLHGVPMKEEFIKRFSKVGVTVKNMPDREIDLLDIDDVYGYLGGMNALARAYGSGDTRSYMGDGSDPDKVRVRSTSEELKFTFRSKVLNPRFIAGLKRHGYRGAAEIANLAEYMFGWDATSDAVDDWMYEKMAERYLFDDDTREWMNDENPEALMDVVNRLMEAHERGMWNARQETLDRLRDVYAEAEERIEEVNDR